MTLQSPHPRPARSGFSLLELLLAVTIMSVIVVALYGMFYHVQRGLRANVNQVDVLEGGRAALDLLARELTQMAPSHRAWGLNATGALSGAYAPTVQVLADGVSLRTNVLQEVAFLTRYNQEFTATAYRVLYAEGGVGVLSSYSTNALPWQVNPTNLIHAALSAPPELFSPMLEGVIHFRVLPYDLQGVKMEWWRTNVDYGPHVLLLPDRLASETRYGFFSNALPAFVEVELGVLEPQTWEQYRTFPAGSDRARRFLAERSAQVHLFRQWLPIRRGWQTTTASHP
ncbi:MAG: prepilin-type N-terminal cleavage/methylation domain-containing protein [Verrucomicrobia bacterium]|nr:MAG: prepilin-type N-terminal cleavage/methylation domain-containing protein [Verrucomicrobiota bacterium]